MPLIAEVLFLFPICGWVFTQGEGLSTVRPIAVIYFWLGLGAAFGLSALYTVASTRQSQSKHDGESDHAHPKTPIAGIGSQSD